MKNKNPKASTLMTALIVLGMILAIAIGVSTVSVQERRSSIGSNQSITAYQNADTGVERVLNELIKVRPSGNVNQISISGTSCNSSTGLIEDSAGKFRVELQDSSDPPIQILCDAGTSISSVSSIKSIGISPQESRSIEVALAQAGGTLSFYITYRGGASWLANPLTGNYACPVGTTNIYNQTTGGGCSSGGNEACEWHFCQ